MSQSFCISDQSILIADYNDKYNNDEKVWNIAKITKTWPRDAAKKHSWENDTDSSVWHKAATNLQFVKKKMQLSVKQKSEAQLYKVSLHCA